MQSELLNRPSLLQQKGGAAYVQALERELRSRTTAEVRFDAGSRGMYTADASNYRQVPIGVVVPRTLEDIVQAVRVCSEQGVPITLRGGGTSLAGQGINMAVIIDTTKYVNRVLGIDPEQKLAYVEPGVILDEVRERAVEHCLTVGPDPATHNRNVIGGMLGNNSCGIHSVLAEREGTGPRMSDNVQEIEILTYDGARFWVGPTSEVELERIIRMGGRRGEIYSKLKSLRDRYANLIRARFPQIPRRVSGYNLDELLPEKGFNVAAALVGTEGTCVTFLRSRIKLVKHPKARIVAVLGYEDIYSSGDDIDYLRHFDITGLEGIDSLLTRNVKKKGLHTDSFPYYPDAGGWLLIEFGGETVEEARAKAEKLTHWATTRGKATSSCIYTNDEDIEKVWKIRESGLGATARVPGQRDAWPGWEDSAVPPARMGEYLRSFQRLLNKYDYKAALYGHFGQGCLHCRIDFDLETEAGIERYRSFVDDAADLCLSLGGSLSGEHGDGQSRGELLEKMYGRELVNAFREFKAIWDPEGKMNPGKVIDAYPITSNLRFGANYNPLPVETHFKYPDDQYSFSRATKRCVGVGQCRRLEGGTMCPSFMVTREEKHSTRGRARLLFEMLEGNPIQEKWQSEDVKESLDLCLACKGCKTDCPVNVDMATYKAEFLSHYYQGHRRPRAAYSMGLIFLWSRVATKVPGLVNFLTQTPGLSAIAKAVGGMSQKRSIPLYAEESFQTWYARRGPKNPDGKRLILWPDTFNNYFHTQTAKAALEVLEAAGYQVIVPEQKICCGRPLYDFGFMDQAKRQIQEILSALREDIRAGTPVVGLEPSCVSVLRDEMINLFPHDKDAQRLSQETYTFTEFLVRFGGNLKIPELKVRATVHGHCHDKTVLDESQKKQKTLLERLGLKSDVLDSGCCGMAGSFGFEPGDKYDVSQKCGERVLLPKVREADPTDVLIADGFSCRTQIEQNTDRRALHTAEVVHLALSQSDTDPLPYPERRYSQPAARPEAGAAWAAAGVAAALAGIYLGGRAMRKNP